MTANSSPRFVVNSPEKNLLRTICSSRRPIKGNSLDISLIRQEFSQVLSRCQGYIALSVKSVVPRLSPKRDTRGRRRQAEAGRDLAGMPHE